MKICKPFIFVLLVVMLVISCSKEAEVEIAGEYVIFVSGEEDPYDLHNITAEITGDGSSYRIKTTAIGDEEGVEAELVTKEIPYLASFEHLYFTVKWRLTPNDGNFDVIWRDNQNIDDFEFVLRPYTEAEKARVAEEAERAKTEADDEVELDRSVFLVEADGDLDMTVEELVKKIHATTVTEADDFTPFAEDYLYKFASETIKIESVSEALPYDGLYRIICYWDYDNNSWNRNTLRVTLYTENKDIAQTFVKNDKHELKFNIFSYGYDEDYYVIFIDGTLVTD